MKLYEPFPGLTGHEVWLEESVERQSLDNRALLIYFWSLTCCANEQLLPQIAQWDHQYQSLQRLQIIGVHVARTTAEREREAILRAVHGYGLKHPVALDEEGSLATAFDNHIVPATYLFDERMQLRHIQSG